MAFLDKDMEVKEYELWEICDIIGGYAFLSKKYKESGSPIIRAKNVKDFEIDYSSLIYFDEKDYSKNLSKYVLHPGDIAITRFGSSGKPVFNQTNKSFYITHNFSKLEPNPEILDKKYLYHFLINGSEAILNSSTGSFIPRINVSSFRKLKIAVPPLNVQKEIAFKLDKFREIEREISLRNKQYEHYRNYLIGGDK